MIDCILGFWAPGPFEILVIIIYLGIPIVMIVILLRWFLRNKKREYQASAVSREARR